MSSTWRDLADHGHTRAAPRRLTKRGNAGGASLALPAVVMSVLGGAFGVWFLTGAPLGAASGTTIVSAQIRPAVQPPQIAASPALSAESAPTPPISVLIAAMTAAPEPETIAQDPAMMPLALQPTRQITTPAPMTAVVSDAQQISAPRLILAPQPERRPSAPAPVQPQGVTMQTQIALAAPAPLPPTKATPVAIETSVAEPQAPTRGGFAIVLASVETEGAARAKVGQMKQKFGTALGARRLNYHRAKQDGAYVWHVRSAGLSEADAEAVCDRIEKSGGECSVIEQ